MLIILRDHNKPNNKIRNLVIEYDEEQGSPKIKMIDINNRFAKRTQSLPDSNLADKSPLSSNNQNPNGKFHYEISKLEINKMLLHRESNFLVDYS